ncbi:hypothetical protein V7094_27735 [Priestia megaterium]|uniref:hypothetical protein n=1 Tax=Priestia megaterium TaxID=1404 RepID=UPI003000942C
MQENPFREIGTNVVSIGSLKSTDEYTRRRRVHTIHQLIEDAEGSEDIGIIGHATGFGFSHMYPYQHQLIDSMATMMEENPEEPLSMNEKKSKYRKGMNSFLNKGKRYRNA